MRDVAAGDLQRVAVEAAPACRRRPRRTGSRARPGRARGPVRRRRGAPPRRARSARRRRAATARRRAPGWRRRRAIGRDEGLGAQRLQLDGGCAGAGRGVDERQRARRIAVVIEADLGDDEQRRPAPDGARPDPHRRCVVPVISVRLVLVPVVIRVRARRSAAIARATRPAPCPSIAIRPRTRQIAAARRRRPADRARPPRDRRAPRVRAHAGGRSARRHGEPGPHEAPNRRRLARRPPAPRPPACRAHTPRRASCRRRPPPPSPAPALRESAAGGDHLDAGRPRDRPGIGGRIQSQTEQDSCPTQPRTAIELSAQLLARCASPRAACCPPPSPTRTCGRSDGTRPRARRAATAEAGCRTA